MTVNMTRLLGVFSGLRKRTQFKIFFRFENRELERLLESRLVDASYALFFGLRHLVLLLVVATYLLVPWCGYYFGLRGQSISRHLSLVAETLPLPSLATPLSVIWLILAVVLAIAAHELGHIVANAASGVRIRGVGVQFFLLFPYAAFVRYDENNWQSLPTAAKTTVLSSGILVNLGLFLTGLLVWRTFFSGSLFLAWVWLVNGVLGIWNCLPIVRSDGQRLLHYLIQHHMGTPSTSKRMQVTLFTLSWLLVVGSVAFILGAQLIDFQ